VGATDFFRSSVLDDISLVGTLNVWDVVITL